MATLDAQGREINARKQMQTDKQTSEQELNRRKIA